MLRLRWMPLVSVVLASFGVSADEAEPGLEEVVVEAPSLREQAGSIGSVATVGADALELIRPTHINETLARVPGTWISRGSGQEHLTAIRSGVLTGAGACGSFLFLEDGVPLRPAGFCNVNNLFEVNHEQAAAVEVWRGPGSAVLGGNAVRGAINVLSQLPRSARIGLSGGPYGYGQARVEIGGEVGRFDAGVSAHSTRSNGWRDDTGYEQHKATAVAEGSLAGWQVRVTLSGTVLHQETGGFVRGLDAFEDSDLRDTNPNPEAYRDAWSSRLSVVMTRDGWTVTPYARRSQMRFLQHFLPGQPLETNEQSSLGVIVDHAWEGERFRASLGGQLEAFDGALKEFQSGPTVGSAFLVATRPAGLHYDYEVEGRTVAIRWHAEYQANDRLTLLHDARVEHLEYDYDNLHIVGNTQDDGTPCGFGGCLYTRPADRDDDFTDVAARIGLEYAPAADAGRWHAALSTGFRPPQATELYRLQSGQLVADLDSERIVAAEVGWSSSWLEVTAFAQRVRNFIFRDSEGFNVSDGKTRSEGLEVLLSWQPGNHGLDLAATWARHRYDFSSSPTRREVITSGDDVDTAPRVMANLRWRYAWSPTLSQEFELVHVDEYFTNAENTQEYDGHTVLNWRLRWQASEALTMSLRLVNALDEEYADRADFAFGSHRYFPAMPRQLYVGLDYEF